MAAARVSRSRVLLSRFALLLALLGLMVPAGHLSSDLPLCLAAEARVCSLPLLHDVLGVLQFGSLVLQPPGIPELIAV